MRAYACWRDPVSGHAMFKEPFCAIKASFLGHWGCIAWPCLFDAIFDTVDEGQEARPKKLVKSRIQTSRVSKGLDTTAMNWFVHCGSVGFADTSA